ncbi:4-(cytidine 5'-diphospho)-2-C-methyl-D-erythritol kinase [Kozakia baliensis]|uniref:4-diphosphocytidyl-2-C-methyl-D-erythritol kinase n=1 Tax=Kozakia baliensis TaxID=153496 RepID=A0A1D8UVD4_9PROT|nr:4-(cytidine 5'-diphospho)-2-C-methyl-D-erythritol kinase [Kozakia baliensis]AOX17603.1 hypothetical protein A0U89_11100 [Kozakia baliensis]GBR31135.1 4-diphosphocytidyl-2-C-methyl-D-erythritol kinase [Kozakia baliensis NRIC 0488]GEL62916.1 4-diphosphocytidyl-2-C-methyl-D-erythritol kinase [Kozakia baliensis]
MTRARAHAKINLFLHITGRRPNGYHELDSLAVFADTADELALETKSGKPGDVTLSIEGPFGEGLRAESDNLVLRAAAALREHAPASAQLAPLHVTLTKNLPVASGIGGGSADAACALRLIAQAWALPEIDLAPLAARLGADVPVCLAQEPARMLGIGEILKPAPSLPPVAMLLVNPGTAVPTPAIFKAWRESGADFRPSPDLPRCWDDFGAMIADLRQTSNDLQGPAISLYPVIGEVLNALEAQPGCGFARMSGSGATCFGLFDNEAAAQDAARILSRSEWWAAAGPLHNSASI